jgi:MFS transporter, ACS family, hexuronate transporter
VATKSTTTPTNIRWTVCALLFFATTINYLDRQLFSNLVPYLEDDLRLGPVDLSLINVSFLLSYGLGMLFVGRLIDTVGTKKGLGISFLLWNVSAMLHGLVGGFGALAAVRASLGITEAANYPACVKTVGEWFPKRERATANGWFNAGSNIGAVLAPLLAISLAEAVGWKLCFFILGGAGLVWIFFWRRLYYAPADHPTVSKEELEYIRQDGEVETEKMTYSTLLGLRPVYAIALAKGLSESPWWFYLTWLPKFLSDEFQLNATFMRIAIPVVYLIADFGAVGGGWLSSRLIQRGSDVGKARKTAMLVCALSAVPVMAVGSLMKTKEIVGIPTVAIVIFLVAIAASAHQGWSSNVYALITDTVPKSGTAMMVGIATAAGVTGASVFQVFVGKSVELTGSYAICFVIAGGLYLIALLALHLLLPKVEMSQPKRRVSPPLVGGIAAALVIVLLLLQTQLTKPAFQTQADYEAKIASKGGSSKQITDAQVGWMRASWFKISEPGKPDRFELVKFDDAGRPVIEKKPIKDLKKYKGPTMEQLAAGTF